MEWLQSVGDYFYNLLIYQDRYMTILNCRCRCCDWH